jgi:hypothetical protein
MASAGARAYMGVWGHCPQWGPGAKPLVGGLGDFVPQKLEHFHNYLPGILVLGESKMRGERQTLPMVWVRGNSLELTTF